MQSGRHAAAVVAAVLLLGCGGSSGPPAAANSPQPSRSAASTGTWPQDLTLTGEVNAHASATVPDAGGTRSSCTGTYSRASAGYALILAVPTDHGVWQVFANTTGYFGPGTYTSPNDAGVRTVEAGLITAERTTSWVSTPGDPVKFTVGASEEQGTIDATLSLRNHQASTTMETVRGSWTCRTSL